MHAYNYQLESMDLFWLSVGDTDLKFFSLKLVSFELSWIELTEIVLMMYDNLLHITTTIITIKTIQLIEKILIFLYLSIHHIWNELFVSYVSCVSAEPLIRILNSCIVLGIWFHLFNQVCNLVIWQVRILFCFVQYLNLITYQFRRRKKSRHVSISLSQMLFQPQIRFVFSIILRLFYSFNPQNYLLYLIASCIPNVGCG